MGIVYTTRVSNIYEGIKELHDLTESARSLSKKAINTLYTDILFKYVDCLWPSFFNGFNASDIYFGLEMSKQDIGFCSVEPLNIAMRNHIHNSCKTEEEDFEQETPFDVFESFLSVEGIVSTYNQLLSLWVDIYDQTSMVLKRIRYYDDDFKESMKELNTVLCNIMGLCYMVFNEYEVFSKAYVLSKIAKHLYGPSYPHQEKNFDVVTQWLSKTSAHNNITLAVKEEYEGGKSFKQLLEFLALLTNDNSKANRLIVAIQLCGRRLGDEHKKKYLMEYIGKDATLKRQKKLFTALLDECEELKNKHDDNTKKGFKDKEKRLWNFIVEHVLETL